MVGDKILLRERINPIWITLPDGRRYEKVSRKESPANVTIKRTRTIGLRQQWKQGQQGSGLLSSTFILGSRLIKPSYIKKEIEIVSKVINSALGKKLIEEGIKQTLYI